MARATLVNYLSQFAFEWASAGKIPWKFLAKHKRLTIGVKIRAHNKILMLMSYYALEQTLLVFVALLWNLRELELHEHTKSIKYTRMQLSIFTPENSFPLSTIRSVVFTLPKWKWFGTLLINHWVENNLNFQSVMCLCACTFGFMLIVHIRGGY